MCAGVLQMCLWWFLQDGNVKTERGKYKRKFRLPICYKKNGASVKRMIQEIKIGGMYTG